MSISAIVPVWNGRDLLERLLATLETQTEPAAELLVVDNGSEDGAPELARSRGARVIPMGRNAGFAAAVNRGIRESRGEWIAVLNSDVELAPDYFATLRAAASSTDWFATGKILAPDRIHIDGTYDVLSRGAAAWRVGHGCPDGPAFSTPRRIWSPPWTAALFRSDLFGRIGLLEESFESYLEDVDFGLRCAAHECGGWYVPGAVAWHRGSAALGPWHPATVRRIARNQLLLVARHYPREALFRCWWPIAVAQLLWGTLAFRRGAGLAWLRGTCEGTSHFSTAREISTLADPELLELLLQDNEQVIREVQTSAGFETYWRLYFLLTRGGTK